MLCASHECREAAEKTRVSGLKQHKFSDCVLTSNCH